MSYHVVSRVYVGADGLDDRIEIRDEPATTNLSREPRTQGWCGTTNDYSVTAHGCYDTLEAAREAAKAVYSTGLRNVEPSELGVVEEYRVERPEPLDRETTDALGTED